LRFPIAFVISRVAKAELFSLFFFFSSLLFFSGSVGDCCSKEAPILTVLDSWFVSDQGEAKQLSDFQWSREFRNCLDHLPGLADLSIVWDSGAHGRTAGDGFTGGCRSQQPIAVREGEGWCGAAGVIDLTLFWERFRVIPCKLSFWFLARERG
jgi:hypothetical protein